MADFKILENGDYQFADGRIIKAADIGKMYEKEEQEKDQKSELKEGQCSGRILLED